MNLQGKEIVIGITGGIAAYKSAEIVSRLRRLGANVHVIMTRNATEFITPLTFQTLSANQVVTDTFQAPEYWQVEHVALAKLADLFLVAPATANILAKMACGIADDMLSTTLLATKAPIFAAPAMNTGMWTAEATQQNVAILKARGVHMIGPDSGRLACGDDGAGRMSEPADIVKEIVLFFDKAEDMKGMKVLVTAGATRERLDPVRFMTNDSSGKMGIAIAEAALRRGAEVTLVHGAVTKAIPGGIRTVPVESTQDLYDAMIREAPEQDVVIQAAAPADYRFRDRQNSKMKKTAEKEITLVLTENPDVAAAVGERKKPGQTLVGFAAETDDLEANAEKKLKKKHLDLIVANDVTKPGAGFNTETNIATLIWENGREEQPLQQKSELAEKILDKVMELRG
ncbi:MAG: bifunctional phosphopantothenoylcysteine decarboxylase/phosphopantothenate--cysteine ligase CoaBC [Clostridia bacterium]|nr:bifunctional phosphopantothenoylcysteine decarboxylase/phosphopantothenate--cysteine ligase CoaBC [Clostridia bacterium]